MPPPREGALGFLYLPPYRVQGTSVAGDETDCFMIDLAGGDPLEVRHLQV